MYKCPICKSNNTKKLLHLDCGNFDKSTLYKEVDLFYCKDCDHVFNYLTKEQIQGLKYYYNNEYAKINLSHNTGDMYPRKYYENIFNSVHHYVNPNHKILDIGCNTGGFLKFLHIKGYDNTYGVDWAPNFLEVAEESNLMNIYYGELDKLPFEDCSYKVIIADQVLEHCIDPSQSIKNIYRVLENKGILYLSIPNIMTYSDDMFFPYYWLIMREHIHHFNAKTIFNLLGENNFSIISISYDNPVSIGEHSMETINIVAQKVSSKQQEQCYQYPFVESYIKDYIRKSKKLLLKEKLKIWWKVIKSFIQSKTLLLFGTGRECLFLYQNTILKYYKYLAFSDSYQYKIDNLTVGNKKIISNSILKNLYTIYITAFTHKKLISKLINKE